MKRNENISEIRVGINTNDSQIEVFKSTAFSNLFYPYVFDSAGMSFVGLTIDILNKNSKKNPSVFNETLVENVRDRENLFDPNGIWGFIETSNQNNKNRVVSNAFCFCGQNVTFYIAPQYQDCGYFDDTFVYCKTTLVVSVVNLVDGSEEILKTFSDFESEKSNPERYFSWGIPSCYSNLFSSHGIFGMCVLRLSISRKFFKDSELVSLIDNDYPKIDQGLLQLLVYSGANESINVSDLNTTWLDESVLTTDSLEDIFAHSIMSNYEDPNLPLTSDQKRAIAADQIAFLFISQHPTITADNYPSQIVGLGVSQNIRSKVVSQKIKAYSKAYPDTINLAKNRLFGILATYKKYNFISDIESCFDNYTQSFQKLRDPVRTIFIDRNGNLKTKYGINGIQLNPYVINTTETEMPMEVLVERIANLSINNNEIELRNIAITDDSDMSLGPDSRYIKISFSVINGLEEMSRIRYTLWTKNNLNVFEYVDDNPLNNSHIFDCDIFGNILFRVGNNSVNAETGEILFVRIDVESINGKIKSFYAEEFLPSNGIKPGFTKIETFQRQDGSGMVDINYNYSGTSEINNSIVNVFLSKNGGSSWEIIPSSDLIGDYGVAVMPGRNHIAWEPIKIDEGSATEDFGSYVLLKLTLSDVDGIDNYGKDSNIAVIRFDKPIVAIRKLSREEESGMWMSSTSSSTSNSTSSSSNSSSSTSNSSTSSGSGQLEIRNIFGITNNVIDDNPLTTTNYGNLSMIPVTDYVRIGIVGTYSDNLDSIPLTPADPIDVVMDIDRTIDGNNQSPSIFENSSTYLYNYDFGATYPLKSIDLWYSANTDSSNTTIEIGYIDESDDYNILTTIYPIVVTGYPSSSGTRFNYVLENPVDAKGIRLFNDNLDPTGDMLNLHDISAYSLIGSSNGSTTISRIVIDYDGTNLTGVGSTNIDVFTIKENIETFNQTTNLEGGYGDSNAQLTILFDPVVDCDSVLMYYSSFTENGELIVKDIKFYGDVI